MTTDTWVTAQLRRSQLYKAAMAKRHLGALVADAQQAMKSSRLSFEARADLAGKMVDAVLVMAALPQARPAAASGSGLKVGSKYARDTDRALATIVD